MTDIVVSHRPVSRRDVRCRPIDDGNAKPLIKSRLPKVARNDVFCFPFPQFCAAFFSLETINNQLSPRFLATSFKME
jgi:hypothetical protein